jgi:plastocyanin
VRTSSFVLAGAAVLISCGDDASDRGLATRQLAEQAAGARSGTTIAAPPSADAPPTTAAASSPAVEPTGVIVPVLALDNTFRPEIVEVEVGDEVLWENRGLNEHNVLYVEDTASPFGVEVAQFQPGDVYTHVFTEPGEFHYYCSIHGNETVGMIGTVVVSG